MTTAWQPAEAGEPGWVFAALAKISLPAPPLVDNRRAREDVREPTLRAGPEPPVTRLKQTDAGTVVFPRAVGVELDARQCPAGFGPCLASALTGTTIVLAHADPEPIYAESTQAARRAGVAYSASVSLLVPHRTMGALNLYA